MGVHCAPASKISRNKTPEICSITLFGAKGDGKTNATQAFKAALASGCKDVYIPGGTYIVGPDSINIPSNVTIRGAGNASVLRLAPGTGTLIKAGKGCSFSNFTIDCIKGKPGKIQEGVLVVPAGADGVTIKSISIKDSQRVAVLGDHANDLTVQDCSFRNVLMGVHFLFSSRVKVINNKLEDVRHSAIRWWGNLKFESKNMSDLTITGNYIKNTGHDEMLKDYSGAAISGTGAVHVIMANNIVDGAKDVGFDLEWCDDSVITGNIARNCQNAGIALFYGCKHVSITGNTIINDYKHKTAVLEGFWVRAGIWLAYPNRQEYKEDHGHRDISITGNTIYCVDDNRRSIWIGEESENIVMSGNALSGGRIYDDRKTPAVN